MTELRISADFGTSPLWVAEADGGVDEVEPSEVLSAGLAAQLAEWAARYDAIYDEQYPPDSAFASPEEEDRFEQEGRALAEAVAAEVGGRYEQVRYRDKRAGVWVTVTGAGTALP